MKNESNSYARALLAAWILLASYFFANDLEAFALIVVLPIVVGLLLYVAIRSKFEVLIMFYGLIFVAHAINPSFFFLNRDRYAYAGWGAVKDFDFSLSAFVEVYSLLVLFLSGVLAFALVFSKLICRVSRSAEEAASDSVLKGASADRGAMAQLQGELLDTRKRNSRSLALFIIFAAVPLTTAMYFSGIGIATIDPPILPFRIVGASVYLRNLLVPAIIYVLYSRSVRGLGSTALIYVYAIVVGVLSLSKGNVIFALLPPLAFSVVDNRRSRLYFGVGVLVLLYTIVAWARQFVFISNVGSIEMLVNVVSNIGRGDSLNTQIFANFIGGLSSRLSGAQCAVLAYQTKLDDNVVQAMNFFMAKPGDLPDYVLHEVFGLNFPEGVTFGVGLGYIGTVIMLASGSSIMLITLACVTGLLLTMAQLIVRNYLANERRLLRLAAYPVGLIIVFYLYDGDMPKFYYVSSFSAAGLIGLKFLDGRLSTLLRNTKKLVLVTLRSM